MLCTIVRCAVKTKLTLTVTIDKQHKHTCHYRASLNATVRIIKISKKKIHHQHLGGASPLSAPLATPMLGLHILVGLHA